MSVERVDAERREERRAEGVVDWAMSWERRKAVLVRRVREGSARQGKEVSEKSGGQEEIATHLAVSG
jgi:hypothetical protein